MSSEFIHLHVHTQYSLLQGAIWADSLPEKAKSLGMHAVAITDNHNLFGAVDFYTASLKAGVKPIIGCEVIYCPNGVSGPVSIGGSTGGGMSGNAGGRGAQGPRFHHLVLLCKNLEGYQNLCQLVTRSYTETPPPVKGAPAGPRAYVTRELLDRWGTGLVVLSGCLRGEIPTRILTQETDEALAVALWFKKRFGEDFYFELQDSGLPEQELINEKLHEWGEKHGISCVATNDCHYLEPCQHEAHEVLMCIEGGRNLDFERPKSLVPPSFHFRTPAEMKERFARFPEAVANSVRIADKCDVKFRFKDEEGKTIYHLPRFRPSDIPSDAPFDLIEYFKTESRRGLESRFEEPAFEWLKGNDAARAPYLARLAEELAMIEKTGFAGYFMIVADFIQWAKRAGIPVGPGRGSGAGSLVAYALKITDIDPIKFKLLFERFINPERISMPDFDVDFCQDRRGEVIEYVQTKYGRDNVCQIITFGKLQARAVIKDVGRVLGLSFAESDQITKLLPDELDITIERALKQEPRLKERMDAEPRIAKAIEYALSLEGLYRNAGIHAAGVIITEKPVVTYCPMYVSKDGDIVTQFDKDFSEAIGLVKFDFLGLKTLTVIDNALKLVKKIATPGSPEATFQLERMDYEDPKVFALIGSGDTDGVFQVESSGMKDLCSRMLPSSLEDLTAINALYRPGPLGSGMVDDFIDRKHGRKQSQYEVEALAPILQDTYGVILYQEQVMQIARELAGYSLGQADLLRRAMGKKKVDEMALHREGFVRGAVAKGLAAKKAEGIFDLMAKFAEYGFNKSHSAAYGVLTYQTAYLKAHFPAEFMAALMTTEMGDTDKLARYISDARAHGLKVLSADVNRSERRFSVERTPEGKAIRFALEGIKGVGGIAVDSILEARSNGPFRDILDFCQRVPMRKVNKKVLESLTMAGAFDGLLEAGKGGPGSNRASLFSSLEGLIQFSGEEQAERELGQNSLFDSLSTDEIRGATSPTTVLKAEADWPQARKLMLEKQVVGFFMSGHPMDAWQRICEEWLGWTTEKIKTYSAEKAQAKAKAPAETQGQWGDPSGGPGRFRAPKQEVRLAGLIVETREVMTKKGSRMAFGQFEDLKGKIEVVFFPETYAEVQEFLKSASTEAEPVLLTGDLEVGGEVPKILVKDLEWVAEAHRNRVQKVVLKLPPGEITPDQLRELKKRLLQHRGPCPVRIDFQDPKFRTRLELPETVAVQATPALVAAVNSIFGREVVSLV